MEEHTGLEPALTAWKAAVLPTTPMLRITPGTWLKPGGGLCLLSAGVKKERKSLGNTELPWRAGPDLNRLPSPVPGAAHPHVLPARIAPLRKGALFNCQAAKAKEGKRESPGRHLGCRVLCHAAQRHRIFRFYCNAHAPQNPGSAPCASRGRF